LSALAARHRDAYASAEPFPHVVLDELFPAAVANRLADEFPPPDRFWRQEDTAEASRRGKLMSNDETIFGSFTRHLLHHLNSGIFIHFLEALTGIADLIPDPDVSTNLRHFEPGGCLGVHADYNFHPRFRLDRRVNLILYLNPTWRAEWGGQLELWDAAMSRCVRRVEPEFNRCIVFNTTDTTFHGFPEPLRCPPGVTRRSLQLYFFTNGRPAQEASPPHPTVFRRRPQDPSAP
jgi:Rps23 Pro-64 3,4-dihydroxylase Tpa1-like proline 4-hydroxylase